MSRAFLFAVSFLTRLPLPAAVHQVSPPTLARGPLWFPAVGVLIGASTGLILACLVQFLTIPVAAVIALAIEARLTGAMHEDALADSADALGGGWTLERTFEIFKDSRLGTYGVLALCLGVLLRLALTIALITSFTPLAMIAAMALAGGVCRWTMLAFLKSVPPVPGRTSLSGEFAAGMTWLHVALAGLPALALVVPVAMASSSANLILAACLCVVLLLVSARSIMGRLGGSTGDVLGAIAYLAQLAVLIGLTATL